MARHSNPINKSNIQHLASLARLKLTATEIDKFLKELQKIVGYFDDLKSVNVDNVAPLNGGTDLKNVFREDSLNIESRVDSVDVTGRLIEAFPDSDKGHLKVPKVL